MSGLSVTSLRVSYAGRDGPVVALDGFSLEVPPGSLTVLLGESGCGKSTALNAVAGLVHPDTGTIRLGGRALFERSAPGARKLELPPNRRDIGMVFQSYALWPHLAVLDNVMYPVLRRGTERGQAERAARAVLDTVRCGHLAERYPGELSGGQQQRVALARAMVARPSLLLFDEPLSNLDAGLRRGLRDELARLHREIGFTGVYVTHDQSEALALGTQLAVMDGGRIVQLGTTRDIYERPVNEFVARFFGANMLHGTCTAGGRIETPAGVLPAPSGLRAGPVIAAFMPHATGFELRADGPATVSAAMYLGSHWEVRVTAADDEVLVVQPATTVPPEVGARVALNVHPGRLNAFPADGPQTPRRACGEGHHP